MNHFEKSEDLYGVDLALFLKREVKFILKRIDLLEANLKRTVENPIDGYVDYNKCFRIVRALNFWNNELTILRRKL